MDGKKLLDDLVMDARKIIPDLQIKYKDESTVQRAVAKVISVFNPKYLSTFTTTIYPNVWFPSKARVDVAPRATFDTLAHEIVHLVDQRKVSFFLLYAFPQVLAFLALLTPFSWWFLLFLLFLAPIPSPFRAHYELRGYQMSMAVCYWQTGKVPDYVVNHVMKQFTGPSYYFMFPFRGYIRGRLEKAKQEVLSGHVLTREHDLNTVFSMVYNILKRNNAAIV